MSIWYSVWYGDNRDCAIYVIHHRFSFPRLRMRILKIAYRYFGWRPKDA